MTPLEVVGAAGAASGALTATGALAVAIWRSERRVRRMVTRVVGDGVTPGALDRLDAVETSTAAIRAQLSPDSGRSLHDVVVRVDERTLRIEQQLGHVEQRLDAHVASPHARV